MTSRHKKLKTDHTHFFKGMDNLLKPQNRSKTDEFFVNTVKKDYLSLLSNVSLATTNRVSELHLMHTVYGHACAGHGEFYETAGAKKIPIRYTNITIEDVIKEIPRNNISPKSKSSRHDSEDPVHVKRQRQELINDITGWVNDRVETLHDPGRMPSNEDIRLIKINSTKGEPRSIVPLAGALMFEHAVLKNFESVLMGFYMGSCMDSHEWRIKVEEKYGISMHKGTIIPANISVMKRNNITLDDLQNGTYKTKLSYDASMTPDDIMGDLMHLGIISKKKVVDNNHDHTGAYLEFSKGSGISDDAAFITSSLMFGTEAGFGLLLADAIDTLDKYVPMIYSSGQDEIAGKNLKKNYEARLKSKFPISDDQIIDFIYLSAIRKEDLFSFPSCSQRRFWQLDSQGMTAVQSHMAFLNHIKSDSKYPPYSKIGFKQIKNSDFYEAYENKIQDAMKNNGIILERYVERKGHYYKK